MIPNPHRPTVLVAADMSQLELRISAYMSRDPVMMDILRAGRDMHCVTAQAVYGLPDEIRSKQGGSVTDALRNPAKVVNYLTGYGGQKRKMQEGIEKMVLQQPELGLEIPSLDECQHALNIHRKLYKQYWEWVKWTILRTRELGYSETAFGRPRFFPFIDGPHPDDRAEAERACVNHAIQGTAADLIKMAQVHIASDELMCQEGDMVLQVHDEIVSIVWKDMAEWYKARINKHMALGQPFEPYVELVVDTNYSFRWGEAHK